MNSPQTSEINSFDLSSEIVLSFIISMYFERNYNHLIRYYKSQFNSNMHLFITSPCVKKIVADISSITNTPKNLIKNLLSQFILTCESPVSGVLNKLTKFNFRLPIRLIVPITACIGCNTILKWRNDQNVIYILPQKLIRTVINIGYCPITNCDHSSYYLNYYVRTNHTNSKKYILYDHKKQFISNAIRINQVYIIHNETISIWIQGNVLANGVRCWNSQLNYMANNLYENLPHPKNSPLFTRAFIIYNIMKFNRYMECNQSINPVDKLYLSSACTNNDPYADLRTAIVTFNNWYRASFASKWKHTCKKCHLVSQSENLQVSYMVMDGKVIGHQVCRKWSCSNTIANRKIGFCQQHLLESNFCFLINCNGVRNKEVKQPYSFVCNNSDCKDLVAKFWKKNVWLPHKKGPVSVEDLRKFKLAHEKAGFRYPIRRKYLSSLFVGVWGCGMIMNVKKLFTHESHSDITEFLEETIASIDEIPSVIVYDKACQLLKTLKNEDSGHGILHDLAHNVNWIVDKFHFRLHSDNDFFCKENCDPYKVTSVMEKMNFEFKMNTSAAEQCNSWLVKFYSILKYLDADIHDFILYSVLDERNNQLSNKFY